MPKYATALKKFPLLPRNLLREMRDKFRKPLRLSTEQLGMVTEQEIQREITLLEARVQMVDRVIAGINSLPPAITWKEARNILLIRFRQKELKRLWSYQALQLKKRLPGT